MAYLLVYRRYSSFKEFGGGFEGNDHSGPSTSLEAKALTIGIVVFSVGNVGSIVGYSLGTALIGWGSSVHHFTSAVTQRLKRNCSKALACASMTTAALECVCFVAQTTGANPMTPLAPDIDTFADFQAIFRSSTAESIGKIRGDSFPIAEIIVYNQCLTPALIFDFRTTGGMNTGPIACLMGSGEGNQIGELRLVMDVDECGQFNRSIDSCSTMSG